MKDYQKQTKRQELLEQLYEEDGRFDPEHPFHDSYTGLFQEMVQALVIQDNTEALEKIVNADILEKIKANFEPNES